MIIFLILVLAIFTIASAFYQIKKFQSFFYKYDVLQILPNYCFFAPKPISFDYRIVYTKHDEHNWKEVTIYKTFHFYRFLWNPFKYYNKGFIDSCQFLLQEFQTLEDKNFIKLSLYYLNFLTIISKTLDRNIVKKKYQNSSKCLVRFAIINSKGVENINVDSITFLSFNQII